MKQIMKTITKWDNMNGDKGVAIDFWDVARADARTKQNRRLTSMVMVEHRWIVND